MGELMRVLRAKWEGMTFRSRQDLRDLGMALLFICMVLVLGYTLAGLD